MKYVILNKDFRDGFHTSAPNDPHWHVRGDCTLVHFRLISRLTAIFPLVSLYNQPFSKHRPIDRCTKWSKMTGRIDMFEVKGTAVHVTYTPRPNCRQFRSTMRHLRLTEHILNKYTEWPQNDPDTFEVKITSVYSAYTPRLNLRLTSSYFWVSGQFWRKCTDWPQKDLDLSEVSPYSESFAMKLIGFTFSIEYNKK